MPLVPPVEVELPAEVALDLARRGARDPGHESDVVDRHPEPCEDVALDLVGQLGAVGGYQLLAAGLEVVGDLVGAVVPRPLMIVRSPRRPVA